MARVRTGRIWLRMDIFWANEKDPGLRPGSGAGFSIPLGGVDCGKAAPAFPCDIHAAVIFCREGFHTLTNMRDEPMSYSFTPGKSEGTTVLKLVGPLTITTMFGFQNELRANTSQVLIVDMSEVPYMDSAGLGLIMNSHVAAQDHSRRFMLAGVNERVMALCDMTKVSKVLTCFPSVDSAEASV